MSLAYETYGRLAPDGRNAILVTHGFTSSQHAAGKYSPSDPTAGSWDGLIGPGKAIDTTRFFVVSSNMLGSSYGSTAPASPNPATGKPYGPDFPDITVRDIVRAQKLLLAALNVNHLVAATPYEIREGLSNTAFVIGNQDAHRFAIRAAELR